jgi:hypothetical protein
MTIAFCVIAIAFSLPSSYNVTINRSNIMTVIDYEHIFNMARQLRLEERLKLLQALLDTVTGDVVESSPRRSIFELKGVGRDMWRKIDVDEYIRRERASKVTEIEITVVADL